MTLKVSRLDISELSPDPSNLRTHSEKNIDTIKASLRRFGQQKPIVIDNKNIVIAGNGTLEAAKALGWDTIDIVKTDLTGSDRTAFAIADNRTAELAEWNDEDLDRVLRELASEDEFILDDLGFSLNDFKEPIVKNDSKELNEEDFSSFDNTCPKCGFEFDNS